MTSKRVDTNKLLKDAGYAGHPEFGQIAGWVASQQFEALDDILPAVTTMFGEPVGKLECNNKAPLNLFLMDHTDGELVQGEMSAVSQMHEALRIPVAIRGALMPDAHLGYALPIGGVIELDHAISPSFVGVDIYCRMSASLVSDQGFIESLEDGDFRKHVLGVVLANTSFGVGAQSVGNTDHEVMYDNWWDATSLLKGLKGKAHSQLGTSGGGNHFCSVLVGDVIHDQAGALYGGRKFAIILTHSGSRGTGLKVANHYIALADEITRSKYKIKANYGWLPLESEPGQEYLTSMLLLGSYAKANHDIIHERLLRALGVGREHHVENNHNFAAVRSDGTVLHRKGATPAGLGTLGIIPGTCGTPSYIAVGMGNSDSMMSASHGAGRVRSSSASKKVFDEAVFEQAMEGITHAGIAKHESPHAYKPIDDVISYQHRRGLLVPAIRMTPKVVVMAGDKKDD